MKTLALSCLFLNKITSVQEMAAEIANDVGSIAAAAVSVAVAAAVTKATAAVSAANKLNDVAPASVMAAALTPVLPETTAANKRSTGSMEMSDNIDQGSAQDSSVGMAEGHTVSGVAEESAVHTCDRPKENQYVAPAPLRPCSVAENEQQRPANGRLVYSAGPRDGAAVWVAGSREKAALQVGAVLR